MNLSELGALGEVVGGIGVIASLIYLALQIRQSSKVAKAAATQSILGNSVQSNAVVAGDVSPLIAKLRQGQELEPEESFRLFAYQMATLAQSWQVHEQHRHQMLEPEIFEAYDRRTRSFLEIPAWREFWKVHRFRFGESFQAYIDEMIEGLAE